jgi:hypothetical protein
MIAGDPMLAPITALLVVAALVQPVAGPPARLKVTHRALRAQCINGQAPGRARAWTLDGSPVTLALTMANNPRPGVRSARAGTAVVTFTPEAGHQYEVEVRAPAQSYSQRVWVEGDWAPVVRDRTTDAIVSAAPSWTETPCAGAAPPR